ncbi:MAG: pyridoxal phosphate-dependent aminotransferase [Endomicrobia bacterium]|nr:pyridoxal phosphate-dependent aminotransferase [Endomicrobiia bacterium]MCL2506338.1 pyridoxal phosphate-dependent aminotransferase [Endomicrobiia bacterium]
MKYNFDKVINRKNTDSLKCDFVKEYGFCEGTLPLWVADMDFPAPPEVTDALVKSARHAIFGYTVAKDDYYQAVQNWFLKRFNFKSEKEWIVQTPGVVFAISMAIRAFTKQSDAVLIQTPVYHPFHAVVKVNKRKLVKNSLVLRGGKYEIDFADFEKKIKEEKVKLFILCSPHNPVGRVWSKEELKKIGNICLKYGVIVVSDDIHCDFVYKGFKHTVFAGLSEKFLKNSVTCTAPSKTFNLSGLQASNIFIANDLLRKKFEEEIKKTGYEQANTMGLVACKAAYLYGEKWVDELNAYIEKNIDFVETFLKENMPQIKLIRPQGTYLLWLDFRSLNLKPQQLKDLVSKKAKLWFSYGQTFGIEGKGFFRMNAASPLSVIKEALKRLEKAVNS